MGTVIHYSTHSHTTLLHIVYVGTERVAYFLFQVMTLRVLGVGVGLFIIIALWAVAILFCIISHRTHKHVGTAVVAIATVVTLILILIPRDSEIPKKAVLKVSTRIFFIMFWFPLFLTRTVVQLRQMLTCIFLLLCMDMSNKYIRALIINRWIMFI
jgi:hypothetical protein